MTWEVWFQTQNVDEVRKSLSTLDQQNKKEETQVHNDIGERYSDIVTLSERLESLKILGSSLETHIGQFGGSNHQVDVSKKIPMKDPALAIVSKTEQLLLASAERSIAQHKYAITARVLYVMQILNMNRSPIALNISERLTCMLENWVVTGTYVSQNMYNACLIHFRLSPAKLLEKLLEAREQHIIKLLSPRGSIPNAFNAIDSALFIYNQIVSDYGLSRLSQQRVSESPEFTSMPLLCSLLNQDEWWSNAHAYPEVCYGRENFIEINGFIENIGKHLESTAVTSLDEFGSVPQLIELLREIITQAESSLSDSNQGISTILNSFVSSFSLKLLGLVPYDTYNDIEWREQAMAMRKGIQELSKLARNSKNFAPMFSESLSKLESSALSKLQESTKSTYSQWKKEILKDEIASQDLVQIAKTISKIASLNESYKYLDGTPDEIPTDLYKQLAKKLVETRRDNAKKPRQYWDNPALILLYDIQGLLDEFLGDYEWDNSGLAFLRESIMDELNEDETSPDVGELLGDTENSFNRSSLLLKPLVK